MQEGNNNINLGTNIFPLSSWEDEFAFPWDMLVPYGDLFVFCYLSLPEGNFFFVRVAVQNPENWVGSDIFRISFMEPTVNQLTSVLARRNIASFLVNVWNTPFPHPKQSGKSTFEDDFPFPQVGYCWWKKSQTTTWDV